MVEFLNGPGQSEPRKSKAKNLSRSMMAGVRVGYDVKGVYWHEDHEHRYFGVPRENASLSLVKQQPETIRGFANDTAAPDSTTNLLSKLYNKVPEISDDLRAHVLRSSFAAADINKNKVLSKVEIQTMFRKLIPVISKDMISVMFAEANMDGDDGIDYDEFVAWLTQTAPDGVKAKVRRALYNEVDVVKATFRIWDKNGDGLISKAEMHRVLKSHMKDLNEAQRDNLIDIIDTDDDDKIEYAEFVDFLFHRHKKGGLR